MNLQVGVGWAVVERRSSGYEVQFCPHRVSYHDDIEVIEDGFATKEQAEAVKNDVMQEYVRDAWSTETTWRMIIQELVSKVDSLDPGAPEWILDGLSDSLSPDDILILHLEDWIGEMVTLTVTHAGWELTSGYTCCIP